MSGDEGQVWVLARLVTLSDYSVTTITEELALSEDAEALLKQYMVEMCDKKS
ncbi:hypothetical protein KUL98_002849 [Vibrio parahaemolyticus]|nr:hypothetical protein [Vibrio parahaemolyticus]